MPKRDFYVLLTGLNPVHVYNLKEKVFTINIPWGIGVYFVCFFVHHLINLIFGGYWAKSWFYMSWMHLSFFKAFGCTKCSTSCSMIVKYCMHMGTKLS